MRLIDADAFLESESEAYMTAQVALARQKPSKTYDATRLVNSAVHKKIQMLITDAPTIEPKHGKWIWKDRHLGSIKYHTGEDALGQKHTIQVDERYVSKEPFCPFCGKRCDGSWLNFCGNCGADMRKEKNK